MGLAFCEEQLVRMYLVHTWCLGVNCFLVVTKCLICGHAVSDWFAWFVLLAYSWASSLGALCGALASCRSVHVYVLRLNIHDVGTDFDLRGI